MCRRIGQGLHGSSGIGAALAALDSSGAPQVELVLCHVDKAAIRALLEAHGAIARVTGEPGARLFATVDEGMQFVEEQYLKVRPAARSTC